MAIPADGTAKTYTISGNGINVVKGWTLEANTFYTKEGSPTGDAIVIAHKYEYVDLGLSVKWATCNVGASSPEEYGDYFAWGEIEPYYADGYIQESPCTHWRSMTTGAGNSVNPECGYLWRTYSQGASFDFAEWTNKPYDTSTNILNSDRDVATVNWGGGWRMPTSAEFAELFNDENTSWAWTTDYNSTGVKGYIVTGKKAGYTDKSIFLPVAGYRTGTSLSSAGSLGLYWSSSLDSSNPSNAYNLNFNSGNVNPQNNNNRYYGFTVRPVQ